MLGVGSFGTSAGEWAAAWVTSCSAAAAGARGPRAISLSRRRDQQIAAGDDQIAAATAADRAVSSRIGLANFDRRVASAPLRRLRPADRLAKDVNRRAGRKINFVADQRPAAVAVHGRFDRASGRRLCRHRR